MICQALASARSGAFLGDAAGRDCIVAHNDIGAMHYVGTRTVACLVLQRILLQPLIQGLMCATVKLAEVVSPAQSLNRGKFSHFDCGTHESLNQWLKKY